MNFFKKSNTLKEVNFTCLIMGNKMLIKYIYFLISLTTEKDDKTPEFKSKQLKYLKFCSSFSFSVLNKLT